MTLKELKGLPVYLYTPFPAQTFRKKTHIPDFSSNVCSDKLKHELTVSIFFFFFLRGLCVPDWLPIEARGPSESGLAPASPQTTTCSEKTMGK